MATHYEQSSFDLPVEIGVAVVPASPIESRIPMHRCRSPQELAAIITGKLDRYSTEGMAEMEEMMIRYSMDRPTASYAGYLENVETVANYVDRVLQSGGHLGYITGAWEFGPHHVAFFRNQRLAELTLLVGVETNEYISTKGREPLYDYYERASFVRWAVGSHGYAFPVPLQPTDVSSSDFYDKLAVDLGVRRRYGVFHLCENTALDTEEGLWNARLDRAYDESHFLVIRAEQRADSIWTEHGDIHVTGLLKAGQQN